MARGISSPVGATETPLIGRDAEVEYLRGLLDLALHGQGRALLIIGEAGIGKSRLVRHIGERAEKAGVTVAIGIAEPLGKRRPFGALGDALGIRPRAADERRAAIAADLLGSDDQAARLDQMGTIEYRVTEAIIELVELLCEEGPLLLVIENLQWVDQATLSCLRQLVPLIAQYGALIIATGRPDLDGAARWGSLGDHSSQLDLGPLDAESVSQLAAAAIGRVPGLGLVKELDRAGGNPLFISELLAVIVREEMLETTGEVAEIVSRPGSTSLPLTILHRISLLPPATMELLGVASVVGSSFDVSDLSLLSGRPAIDLVGPLRQAVAAGVLRNDGNGLAFCHDVIHEALYSDVPQSIRLALHLDFGRALIATGATPSRVAEHLVLGAQRGDRQAAEWLHRSGRETARRAPGAAIEILQRAAEVAGDRQDLVEAIQADLCIAFVWAGQNSDGETLARQILARTRNPAVSARVAGWLGFSLIERGQAGEALEVARAALSAGVADGEDRRYLLCVEGWGSLFIGDRALASDVSTVVMEESRREGDPVAEASALMLQSFLVNSEGRIVAAARAGAEAAAIAERTSSAAMAQTVPHLGYAAALWEMDCMDEARHQLNRGRQFTEAISTRVQTVVWIFVGGYVDFWTGRWDDALASFATGFSVADQTETGWRVDVLSIRAMIAAHRGARSECLACLADAHQQLAAGAPVVRPDWLFLAQSLSDAAVGDADAALSSLRETWVRVGALGLPGAYLDLGSYLARLAAEAGDSTTAEEVAHALADLAARNPDVARVTAISTWCAGLANNDVESLLQAADYMKRGPRPLERGLVCEDTAVALVRAGRPAEARRFLDDAIGAYQSLDAAERVAAAVARLRRQGLRVGIRGRRQRPVSGWDALTDTERRVVVLIGDHLSNPEIADRMYLSRRTVETHVSHALAKLGFTGRTQLATEAMHHAV